jgi:hypothetical protein
MRRCRRMAVRRTIRTGARWKADLDELEERLAGRRCYGGLDLASALARCQKASSVCRPLWNPGSGSDRRAPLPSRAPPGEPGQGRSDPPAIRPSSPSRKAALLYLPEPFQVAAQPPDVGPGAILRDPVEVLRAREFEERKIVLAGNEHRRGWAIVWRICIKWLHRGRATHAAIRRETKRIN